MFPFLIQGSNITVVIGNKTHTISKTHITYERVKDAIKKGDWELVQDIIEPKKVVINYGQGNVSIQGETLYWKGQEFHHSMAKRMIEMLQEGFSIEPMILFMENLMQNPSYRSVQELYGFLEKNNLPITPDGHFLAYKKVRNDYTDVHSGKFDNSVGSVCEMERNMVDDKAENTCSTGLHFCSQEYLKSFGGDRLVIVKINPRDVVSIPVDYNNSKGRTCRYEVVGEVGLDATDDKEFTKPVQHNANSVKAPEPKVGTGDYARGYEDGYFERDYKNDGIVWSNNYEEGYHDGQCDGQWGNTQRYSYQPKVVSNSTTTSSTFRYSWPLAKKQST
jgi:hypothetical protein